MPPPEATIDGTALGGLADRVSCQNQPQAYTQCHIPVLVYFCGCKYSIKYGNEDLVQHITMIKTAVGARFRSTAHEGRSHHRIISSTGLEGKAKISKHNIHGQYLADW